MFLFFGLLALTLKFQNAVSQNPTNRNSESFVCPPIQPTAGMSPATRRGRVWSSQHKQSYERQMEGFGAEEEKKTRQSERK